MSAGAAGGVGAGGAGASTLGGLVAGSGALPAAMQPMMPTASPNWSYYFGQLQNQLAAMGQQSQPVPPPTPPPPGRSAFGLRLFGASMLAVHGLGSILREQQEETSVEEMTERGDTIGATRAQLGHVEQQRKGFGGWFRSILNHNQRIRFSMLGSQWEIPLGWGDRFNDPQAEREQRQALARDEGNNASDQLMARTRRTDREASSLNLNPIERARVQAEQSSDEARQSVKPLASVVTALRNLGMKSAAGALEKSIGSYTSSVDALGAARVASERRVMREDISDIGAEDEIATYRGNNQPLQAARNALSLRHDQVIRDYERTNDPRLKSTRILFADEDSALRKTQARAIAMEGESLEARNDAMVAMIGRNPLAARLREIQGRSAVDLIRTPKDADYDANRARITLGANLESNLAKQEDQDRRERLGLQLTGQGQQIASLIRHNPVGAEVAGIVTSGLDQALALRNAGLGQFSAQSLQNSIAQLQLTKQNFLESFHATEIGQNFDTGSPRATAGMDQIFKDIQSGIDKLTAALKDASSAK